MTHPEAPLTVSLTSRVSLFQPLMLGERSKAYLSDRTRSLRVRNCAQVSLVPEALSNAISLTDIELSDIATLELKENSMYTDNGQRRRVTVQRVADLQVDPQAFNQVTQLKELNIADVKAGPLPLDSFANRADVVALRLTNSVAEDVSLKFGKSDNVTVSKCKLESLSADIGDVLTVTIADNTIKRVDTLRVNVRPNAHSSDTNTVMIARNAISAMDSEDVQMKLDTFKLVNNTLGSLMAPLRVDFTTAEVTGNEIGRLAPSVFDEFIRLDPVNLRGPGAIPAEFAFTFGDNTLRASSNGSYGRFLTPADERDGYAALFRVYGNRFTCRCEEMKELVRIGEEDYLRAQNEDDDGDDLFQLEDVYGALYSTSRCVDSDQKLEQYRLLAYSAEFECQESKNVNDRNGASSAAAGALTLLLAAATALGLTV